MATFGPVSLSVRKDEWDSKGAGFRVGLWNFQVAVIQRDLKSRFNDDICPTRRYPHERPGLSRLTDWLSPPDA
jgi:hypothetical protein